MNNKYLIAGNWKMNLTISEGVKLVEEIKNTLKETKATVAVMVPATHIVSIKEALKGSDVKIGAQNCHFEKNGAFTGEISTIMLADIGVDYVVLGHSERREMFNETDETVNKKIKAVLASGIAPIFCVGETLGEREAKKEKEIIKNQIVKGLDGVLFDEKIVVAYEPIWAIGTGVTASTEQAEEMCAFIRETLSTIYTTEQAVTVIIQYGGSMKPDNAVELLSQANINGGLIGGASLSAGDFTTIAHACK